MPLISVRKAIRFKSLEKMQEAIVRDDDYQHRHLILNDLCSSLGPTTRRAVSESTGIPVNAVSKVVSMLIEEGVLISTNKIPCKVTGRNSKGIAFNNSFKGPY